MERIAKIVITHPNGYLKFGAVYKVIPTPFYYKSICPNSLLGVWVFHLNIRVYVPFFEFQIVESVPYPTPVQFGFVPSHQHVSGQTYWHNEHSRLAFLRIRQEYWNLA
jgi:hypothetical protein